MGHYNETKLFLQLGWCPSLLCHKVKISEETELSNEEETTKGAKVLIFIATMLFGGELVDGELTSTVDAKHERN